MRYLRYGIMLILCVAVWIVYQSGYIIGGDETIAITVSQNNSEVRFRFFTVKKNTWINRDKTLPVRVYHVVVGDEVADFWEVAAQVSGHNSVTELTYGSVPKGYRQITPESGSPPVLEPGKKYTVSVRQSGGGNAKFEFKSPVAG